MVLFEKIDFFYAYILVRFAINETCFLKMSKWILVLQNISFQ